MRRLAALTGGLLGLMLSATAALGQGVDRNAVTVVSPRSESASVVIYRDRPVRTADLLARSQRGDSGLTRQGLALIVETRTIDLPEGEAVIRFEGVATGIVGQSAILEGLPAGVIERNTDFDLLTPGSLFERSVGETVRVVRVDPVTGRTHERAAIIRAGAQGPVLEVDGAFEALSCTGLSQRVVFDRVPEGLNDQPSLSVRVRGGAPGRHVVTLAYLTTGLQWSADYVAELATDGQSVTLTGWLTLANFGGTGFENAPVQAVAGHLRTQSGTVPVDAVRLPRRVGCWPQDTTTHGVMPDVGEAYYRDGVPPPPPPAPPPVAAPQAAESIVVTGSRIARQEDLGDYKIYTLPERTTMAARQTKQVRFLERVSVPVQRIHRVRVGSLFYGGSDVEDRPTAIILQLDNSADSALGVALPGGNWNIRERDGAGRLVFSGESRSEDGPVGLPVELEFGTSANVRVSTRQIGYQATQEADGTQTHVVTMEVTIRNAGRQAAVVELIPSDYDYPGYRVLSESQPHAISANGYPAWMMQVGAGGHQTLTYSYSVRH